jgi:nucleotide-binding universal stress UspA family protein
MAASGKPHGAAARKPRTGLKYCIAVDGSELSLRTFHTAAALRNPGDPMTVLHIADDSKDYLPYDLRPSSIREQYDVECVGRVSRAAPANRDTPTSPLQFPTSEYSIVVKSKHLGQTTREAVLAFVNDGDFDVFCVGMVGRKGPKDDPTVLGSTSDYSLRGAHCTAVVVKGRGAEVPKVSTFLVACDGSVKSQFCLQQVLRMGNEKDVIIAVHVAPADQEGLPEEFRRAAVEEGVTKVIGDDPRCSLKVLDEDRDSSIADVLSEYALENSVDYIAMGADGVSAFAAGKKVGLGSVSDRLVKIARCSVIVTQNAQSLLPYSG